MSEVESSRVVPASELKVAGITPFTSIDFPGRLSAVVFVQGCPCQCVYCQNNWMQPRAFDPRFEHSDWASVEALLRRRHGLLDGVVFSGGEPTIDPALPEAIRTVKAMGYAIGLHTSGVYSERLRAILPELTWVGLDVKGPPTDVAAFEGITQMAKSQSLFLKSFALLHEAEVAGALAVEYRTTAHPDFLNETQLEVLAAWLAENGVDHWVLQIYRRPRGLLTQTFDSVLDTWPSAPFCERQHARFKSFQIRRL